MRLTLAREIAYDAFVDIMDNQRKPEEVLDDAYDKNAKNLKRLDRNFIKEMVYGSLRWYSKMYWILQNTAKRDLGGTTPQIRAALIVGTYQIFYMDRVPDRAAVNESVEYIRQKGQANATSFVNGILRQIARRAAYFPKPDKDKEQVEYLALQFAHPKWIVERWVRHFNFERMEKILASNNQPPPYSVRFNTFKTPTEKIAELQDQLLRDEKTHTEKRNLRSALRFREPPLLDQESSLFQQGFYTIQDEASQLIGYLVDPKPNEIIIDACAGPGGKLSHIYELVKGQCQLIAVERSKIQFNRAQSNMERLGFSNNVTWHREDFLKWSPEEKADKVQLDAPCSGLGVLRRHPEGKWQKDLSAISKLASIQRELILHALKTLKPGGELIYSVCSFEPEETSQHLMALLETYDDKLELISPVSRLPDYFKKYVTRDNLLLVYSGNQDDMDGFGAFCLRVKESFT